MNEKRQDEPGESRDQDQVKKRMVVTMVLCGHSDQDRGVSRGRHCSTAAEDPRSQPAGTSRQCEQVSTAAARKPEKKKLKVKDGVERAECSLDKSATLLSEIATFILVQAENIVHKNAIWCLSHQYDSLS